MYSYKLNTESESLNVQLQTSSWIRDTECTVTNFILNQSLNVQLQTSSWIRVTECTVTNLILNQRHWMYSYKLHAESVTECTVTNFILNQSLNVQLQTSSWIRVTECTVTNFILNQSLNVQLQTSYWIRVTECTVTNFILNKSHWMYSYKLHTESESLNVRVKFLFNIMTIVALPIRHLQLICLRWKWSKGPNCKTKRNSQRNVTVKPYDTVKGT